MPRKIKDEFESVDTGDMSPLAKSVFQSLREALAFERGQLTKRDGVKVHRVAPAKPKVDVKALRSKLGLTQEELALFIQSSVRAVQHWEQKTRAPDGPTLVLLRVLEKHPQLVWDTIRQAG